MDYPGDSTLTDDVKQRIIETFTQSLDLAEEGKIQEAKLGCDFVLRLDKEFFLARTLLDRIDENPGEVHVGDLRLQMAGGMEALPDLDDLDLPDLKADVLPDFNEDAFPDLDDDLPDLTALDSMGSKAESSVLDESLRGQLQTLIDQGAYQGALNLATTHQEEVMADPEVQNLAQLAQQRLESSAFIQQFVIQAEAALEVGDRQKVERCLQKIRAVDSGHPEVSRLEQSLDSLRSEPASGEDRIGQLLEEGNAAFEKGEFQSAIDSWSRIFLIDIDHSEASRRIDEARKRKAEFERQVEEVFHDALDTFEAGEPDGARELFAKVLELQPGHLAAQDYIERIERGEGPGTLPGAKPPSGEVDVLSMPSFSEDEESVDKDAIFVPPDGPVSEVEAPLPREKKTKGGSKKSNRSFLVIAAGLLVAVLVGGWFLMGRWDQFFPNSEEPTVQKKAVAKPSPIKIAKRLYEGDKVEEAFAKLREIDSENPYFEEAEALIQEWEKVVEQEVEPEESQLERVLKAAMTSYEEQRYTRATKLWEAAAKLGEIPADSLTLKEDLEARLSEHEDLVYYLREQDYEPLMPELWTTFDQNREDLFVKHMLVTAYYNLGVRQLKRRDFSEASSYFGEGLNVDEGNVELVRLQELAETYRTRPEDMLYRIYVKHIGQRTL